ncbi:MAG: hypothetical protein AB7F75_01375 [Planctomycetota bacterium]
MIPPDTPRESPETSGFTPENLPASLKDQPPVGRPLALAWITEDHLDHTRRVWGRLTGREVPEQEAVDILVGIRDFIVAVKSELERRQS